jgi:hypothetical protein
MTTKPAADVFAWMPEMAMHYKHCGVLVCLCADDNSNGGGRSGCVVAVAAGLLATGSTADSTGLGKTKASTTTIALASNANQKTWRS